MVLTPADVSELVVLVTADLATELMDELGRLETSSRGRNSKLQEFTNFPFYLSAIKSEELTKDQANPTFILNLLILFLIDQLALRHLSCPTMAVVATLYNWLAHGEEHVLSMPGLDKYNALPSSKPCFAIE